jgi:hypothetical protein
MKHNKVDLASTNMIAFCEISRGDDGRNRKWRSERTRIFESMAIALVHRNGECTSLMLLDMLRKCGEFTRVIPVAMRHEREDQAPLSLG